MTERFGKLGFLMIYKVLVFCSGLGEETSYNPSVIFLSKCISALLRGITSFCESHIVFFFFFSLLMQSSDKGILMEAIENFSPTVLFVFQCFE